MSTILVFLAMLNLVLIMFLVRALKADGQMIVTETDDKKTYTLQAIDIDSIDKSSRAVFKIVRE